MRNKLAYLGWACFKIGFVVIIVASCRDLDLPLLTTGWAFFGIGATLFFVAWVRGPR